jgi:hypothetical protein
MLARVRRILAWSVLFIGGYTATLPVAGDLLVLPWYFQPIQVAHGVYLRDAILMGYIAIFGMVGSLTQIRLRRDELRFTAVVLALGFAGVLSAVINVTTVLDIGEALRFVVFAAYFILALDWAARYGPTFLLRSFLVGIAAGGTINIYYTYQAQAMVLGILPFLLGQNGPGGFLGLSAVLAAWLMLLHRSRVEILIAVGAAVIAVFAASMSYSRLSMLQAGCGVVAWLSVILAASMRRQTLRHGASLTALVVFLIVGAVLTPVGRDYVESVREFTERKFGDIDVRDPNSVGTRYQYFWGVLDIFMAHPLGVSYGGFYDAVIQTPTYQSGFMADENFGPMSRSFANPHSAFLYYVSANGIFGLVLGPFLFVLCVVALRESLRPFRSAGQVVWLCLSLALFINAMTLPTLFNTEVLYLSAAVAFSQAHRQSRRVVSAERATWSTPAPAY